MPQTLSQKILALHSGREEVRAGELIDADVDIALVNDITGPLSIKELKKIGGKKVFDPNKIVLVNDHFVPNKDIASAEQAKVMREFAREQGLRYFFDVGKMGIEHILLPEQGIVMPYDVVTGADSHTGTYGAIGAFSSGFGSTDLAAVMLSGKVWLKVPEAMQFVLNGKLQKYVSGKDLILYVIGNIGVDGANYKSMEFAGNAKLDISDRLTIANMSVEAGAKNCIFPSDEKTLEYIANTKRFGNSRWEQFLDRGGSLIERGMFKADKDAHYIGVREYDVSKIEPQVALPHSPANVKPISEVEEKRIYVDQVVFGACTNGKIEDLREFAEVFKGHKVHSNVRLIVIPGTQYIWQQGVKEGIAQMVVDAGGIYSTPTCGPCLGGHMGVLAAGEKCLSTTNRNFVGRMGSPKSEVYLANPAVAAATAVLGYIGSPKMLNGGSR